MEGQAGWTGGARAADKLLAVELLGKGHQRGLDDTSATETKHQMESGLCMPTAPISLSLTPMQAATVTAPPSTFRLAQWHNLCLGQQERILHGNIWLAKAGMNAPFWML